MPGPAVPPSYPVYKGWNLVGFKSRYEMLGEEYLGPALGSVVHVVGYDPTTGTFSEIDPNTVNFVPGEAYWMYFCEDALITPPGVVQK